MTAPTPLPPGIEKAIREQVEAHIAYSGDEDYLEILIQKLIAALAEPIREVMKSEYERGLIDGPQMTNQVVSFSEWWMEVSTDPDAWSLDETFDLSQQAVLIHWCKAAWNAARKARP